ncbi:MAG: hypothetical protein RLY93_00760 [Sumerlaeia bacterium]
MSSKPLIAIAVTGASILLLTAGAVGGKVLFPPSTGEQQTAKAAPSPPVVLASNAETRDVVRSRSVAMAQVAEKQPMLDEIDWASIEPPLRRPLRTEAEIGEEFVADAQSQASSAPAPGSAEPFVGFAGARDAKSISAANLGEIVIVTAKILDVRPSFSETAPTTLQISADPELYAIYYPAQAAGIESGHGAPKAGQMVTVRGPLTEYREKLQIKAVTDSDMVIEGTGRTVKSVEAEMAAAASAEQKKAMEVFHADPRTTRLGNLRASLGKDVLIAGYVANLRNPTSERAPYILTLQEPTGSTQVVFWSDMAEGIDKALLKEGTPLMIAGSVDEYRNQLQVKLRDANSIALVKAPK